MKNSNSPIATQITDEQLVVEFQLTGDKQVFAQLYDRYFNKVKIYCLKSLGDEQTAEDTTQEIFLKAFEKLHTLHNPQLWVAWLFSVVRNEVLNTHKQNARHRVEPVERCFSLADEPADREAMEEYDRKLSALPKLLEKAPAGRILKMKYVEGQSIEQLCQKFSMNESAMKMRLFRARHKVVRMYEHSGQRA
jgi:RNA polymerase sigma-70 factor (ECF subfamily)